MQSSVFWSHAFSKCPPLLNREAANDDNDVPNTSKYPDGTLPGTTGTLGNIYVEINETRNNIVGMICVAISVSLLLSAYAIFSYAAITMNLSLFQCLLVVNLVQHIIAWLLWFAPTFITRKPPHIRTWYGEQDSRLFIWLRGFFYFCDAYFYWTGILLLPLGDAECIYFLCPIFIAFGARFILKESFSRTFPFIFLLTAIGVMILSQPPWITTLFASDGTERYFQSEHVNVWGLICLFIGCACWALMSLTVRRIPMAHWTQMELASSLQSFAVWTPLMISINWMLEGTGINLDNGGHWDFSLYPILICVVIGTLLITALVFLDIGYQLGEATKVSWLEYTSVFIGYMYQYVLFHESPNIYETVGASIMLSTGFIEIATEWYLYRKAQIKLLEHKSLILHGLPGDNVNDSIK